MNKWQALAISFATGATIQLLLILANFNVDSLTNWRIWLATSIASVVSAGASFAAARWIPGGLSVAPPQPK